MSYFKCFKYRAINKYLIDSLVSSTMFFAHRDKLNDPFDSQIDLRKVIDSILENDLEQNLRSDLENIRARNEFFDNVENTYKDFGICSFAVKSDNTLMWSHYADEHRGVALYYDMPKEFLDNPEEIMGVSPVTYTENSVSDWLKENVSNFDKDHNNFGTELVKRVITAKSPEWGYENEGRIIRPIAGAYQVPRNILKGIIFGLRTSKED